MTIRVLEAFGEPITYGGQETFVLNYIRNADYQKLSIDYLTPYYCDNKKIKEFVENKSGNIFSLNIVFNPGQNRFNICKSINLFFKSNKYDIVHVHSGSTSILGIFAYYAKKNGVKKVIVHSHASIEHKSLKNTVLRHLCGIVLNKYADIYCACSVAAGEAKFTSDVVRNRLIVIKNGIDLDKFRYCESTRKAVRESLKVSNEDFVIGHVGRFSKEKNHEFLVNLFSELSLNNNKLKLLLVGDGDLRKRIHDLVILKGLQDKVIFTGSVDNVQDYMQAMDYFILPSSYEGLGVVAIEAQAAGLPCLLSKGCPIESKVTDLVSFFKLSTNIKLCANMVNTIRNNKRIVYNTFVRNAGYSIENLKYQLENLYFNNI